MRCRGLVLIPVVLALTILNVRCGGFGSGRGTTSVSGASSSVSLPSDPNPSNAIRSQFDVGLVRIADLEPAGRAAFNGVSVGSDPLVAGRVEVQFESVLNAVQAKVMGALPFATYNVIFCSFATGLSSCLPIGPLTTDGDGSAKKVFTFPQPGTFAGVFLLKRDVNQFQFVTGFSLAFDSSGTSSASVQEEGEDPFRADLQRVADVSGGLGSGFAAAGNDPLALGTIELEAPSEAQETDEVDPSEAGEALEEHEQQGEVEIAIAGAAPNVSYRVQFCRFAAGPGGCFSTGSIATDSQGNGKTEMAFGQNGVFSGVFVLTRSIGGQEVSEFVTGFRVQ